MACRMVAHTGTLIAVSEDLKRFIMSKVGISDSRIQLIYNGVTPMAPVSSVDVDRGRAELDIKSDHLVIGTVGSLYPVKGHQYLLQAMPAILDRFPNTVLLVMDPAFRGVPKEMANELGIADRVVF